MDDRHLHAARMRAEGHTYRQIAAHLGVAEMTVVRWLNPDYAARQREREKARNRTWEARDKQRQREIRRWAKRAWERMTPLEQRAVTLGLTGIDLEEAA